MTTKKQVAKIQLSFKNLSFGKRIRNAWAVLRGGSVIIQGDVENIAKDIKKDK